MPNMLLMPIIIKTGSFSKLVSIIEDNTELIDSGKNGQQPSVIKDIKIVFINPNHQTNHHPFLHRHPYLSS